MYSIVFVLYCNVLCFTLSRARVRASVCRERERGEREHPGRERERESAPRGGRERERESTEEEREREHRGRESAREGRERAPRGGERKRRERESTEGRRRRQRDGVSLMEESGVSLEETPSERRERERERGGGDHFVPAWLCLSIGEWLCMRACDCFCLWNSLSESDPWTSGPVTSQLDLSFGPFYRRALALILYNPSAACANSRRHRNRP